MLNSLSLSKTFWYKKLLFGFSIDDNVVDEDVTNDVDETSEHEFGHGALKPCDEESDIEHQV